VPSLTPISLSFEHGIQKPHPRLFQIALDQLGVTPRETLMVGDRAARDGGAASVGIATLILPAVPNHTPPRPGACSMEVVSVDG
jgi:FMN phosphatase YigB (HAD superfamily)